MLCLPRVLFVCTYRGGRSQIAHFYAQSHARDVFESEAACFDPDSISGDFVTLLASLGPKIQRESPLSVFDLATRADDFDYVVCLCRDTGNEMCALFRNNIDKLFPDCLENLHWNIPDFRDCAQKDREFKDCVVDVLGEIEAAVLELRGQIALATSN